MLLPLLITIPALLSSPPAPQAIAGEACLRQIAQLPADEERALKTFELSVQDYVTLQRRIARRTPPLVVTPDPVLLRDAVDTLGQAVRAERAGAQAGDVLTTAVADVFRRRIRGSLSHLDLAALHDELAEDSEPEARTPVVNGAFPWEAGNAIWPSVLCALPPLPEELQYRFIRTDLVLVDIRANLVVDVLESALPSRPR